MTTFDPVANFGQCTVAVAPSPATSGTSLTLGSGQGASLPATAAGAFNLVYWPAGQDPLSSNTEIVRVTNRAADVLTITRAQEGSTARAIATNDNLALVVTAKTITDLQTAHNNSKERNVLDYGADPTGVTESWQPFQRAINDALHLGGHVFVPAGTYLISQYLVPAYNSDLAGTFTSGAGQTLTIKGAGMYQTTLLAGQDFGYSGLIGYGRLGTNPVLAQVECQDMTFDGNYSGAGGTIAQPDPGAGALISLPWPHTSATSTARNGKFHTFRNCRFYRPPGYTFQPTNGARILGCEFDTTGQPASVVIHYDTLGSGTGEAIVMGCDWHDSTGNYVDFVDGSPTGFVRVIFIGNTSRNHGAGGVYGLGNRSIVSGNVLENTGGGGGIGYDIGTNTAIRTANIIANNSLLNIAVMGQSPATYGDIYQNNFAADTFDGSLTTAALEPSYTNPSALFETFNFQQSGQGSANTRALGGTTGTVYMIPVWLPAGLLINHIVWLSGTTAATTPTHWWVGIADHAGTQQAHSADQTTTAIPANSVISTGLSAQYQTVRSGIYFILISITATTNPTAVGLAAPTVPGANPSGSLISGVSPSAAHPTPGTDGVTAYTVPTTWGPVPYVYGT